MVMGEPEEDRGQADTEHRPVCFSDLLNYLFLTKPRRLPDGRVHGHTLRDVANATGISLAYLSEARRGAKQNPTKTFMERLAAYFEVPPAFFFGPLPGGASLENTYREACSDPVLAEIVLRAGAYCPAERQLLLDLMDSIDRWQWATHVSP